MTQATTSPPHQAGQDTAPASPLARAPIALFSVSLGLGGLALIWRAAGQSLAMPAVIGGVLGGLAVALFALFLALQIARLIALPRAVMAELAHPVAGAFIAAMTMSAMLAGQIVLPWQVDLGAALWGAGAVGHLIVAVGLIARWIARPLDAAAANPVWFLPAIGIILAPQGAAMLGLTALGWMAFGLGMVFWLVFFAIMLNRLMFHDPLPARMLPSLFILMAPPALGLSAWIDLGAAADSPMALSLAAISLFLALVLIALARHFLALSYALSWWAYTFPSAALAGGLLRLDASLATQETRVLAALGLAAATAIIAGVALRGLIALASLVRAR
jgi:tellurite resistance protein